MDKIDIKQKLKQSSSLLKKYHVSRIGLFGSSVRDAHNDTSDIDLVVGFSEVISLFDYVRLSDDLSGILSGKVDLVTMDGIKPLIKHRILDEVEWIEGL